ncbi:hypothetical protein IU500_05755 [Nocardia terpenica]|uniref:hypothetical protein n=1 Tax=Nocardia terpenica TaxID=455432 RepID=UPI0018950FBC|nr:hypothetical protein [Nocardia terpenica]MBF6060286.1 hypothetical protein [Nocardia terpenica]MBF6103546.1 hypothetical protein [Nocardia terpenica]MBF6112080.1 hypothetical protein [Nocardia terpenica]MBF6117767.1 hypothetical protein [Nocardia terpenica]MBF6153489.1 hypothetical protein [Nocardia terpenica]
MRVGRIAGALGVVAVMLCPVPALGDAGPVGAERRAELRDWATSRVPTPLIDSPGVRGYDGFDRLPAASGVSLPERVAFRGDTETFNLQWDFAVRGGRIYVKPADPHSGHDVWRAVPVPACLDGHVVQVSADDNQLWASDDQRNVYVMVNALYRPEDVARPWFWTGRFGAPLWGGGGTHLPADTKAWSLSVLSKFRDRTWTDSAGNAQPAGGADCTTAFVLNDEGNRITILDPWLTGGDDYSYRMATPMGGRLRAQALGSAGSVTFIVDRYGHLFTRNWDFDQSGADQIFFRYSYEDQRGKPTAPDATVLVADNLAPVHGFAAYQLPASDWVEQPAIDGTITDRISIQKIDGQTGSAARILRVEGERNGETGYWEKPITADAWTFVGTGDPLRGNTLAQNSNTYDLAAPSGISYSAKLFGAEVELHDFDTAVADTDLILRDPATGATATLVLHTVDGLRPELSLDELTRALRDHTTFGKRSADLDGTDRKFYGVLELPDSVRGALPGLPESLRQAVEYLTGGREFTDYGQGAGPADLAGHGRSVTVTIDRMVLHGDHTLTMHRSGRGADAGS